MAAEDSLFHTMPETMTLDEVSTVLQNHLGATRSAYETIIRELVRLAASESRDLTDLNGAHLAASLELEEIARAILERGGPDSQDLHHRLLAISKRLSQFGG